MASFGRQSEPRQRAFLKDLLRGTLERVQEKGQYPISDRTTVLGRSEPLKGGPGLL